MLRIVINEYVKLRKETSLINQERFLKLGKIVEKIMKSTQSIGHVQSDLDLAGLYLELGRLDLLGEFLINVKEEVFAIFEK